MIVRRAMVGLVLAALAGTTQAGLFSDDEAHAKIDDLARRVNQQYQALDRRVQEVESIVKSQGLHDLLNQIELLKGEQAKLRGLIEVQTHEIEAGQKRVKDFYADLDARLRQLERTGVTASPAVTPPTPPETDPKVSGQVPAKTDPVKPDQPRAETTPAPAVDPLAETRAYESAYTLYRMGNYPAALSAFQSFLKQHPKSPLASNAQYWIGNAHFSLREYRSAITAQRKLIADFPGSEKVPDALLNIATSQQDLGEVPAARKTLEEIVARYPLTSAADRARKRLSLLKP